jgi:hypothetical protein
VRRAACKLAGVEPRCAVRSNGQIFAIILEENGDRLDGGEREAACKLVGVEPRYAVLPNGQDPITFILSVNVNRRHMSQGQKAMVVAIARPETDRSAKQAAEEVGVSKARVVQAAVACSEVLESRSPSSR